jgi:hypothetical protein
MSAIFSWVEKFCNISDYKVKRGINKAIKNQENAKI